MANLNKDLEQMKSFNEAQLENIAAVVMMLFSESVNLEIGTMREMFHAYVSNEELISHGTEEWPSQLIDNFNGAGYKNTRGGVKKAFNDIMDDYAERSQRMELQD